MPAAVSKQKLTQPMPGPELILFRRFARADQIAQSFVGCIGNPDGRQIAGTMTSGQFLGVAAIRLHSVACFHGNQRRRYDLTLYPERG
jgi:hypothetical protein